MITCGPILMSWELLVTSCMAASRFVFCLRLCRGIEFGAGLSDGEYVSIEVKLDEPESSLLSNSRSKVEPSGTESPMEVMLVDPDPESVGSGIHCSISSNERNPVVEVKYEIINLMPVNLIGNELVLEEGCSTVLITSEL